MKKRSFFSYLLMFLSVLCVFWGLWALRNGKKLMECVAPYEEAPTRDENGSIISFPLLDALKAMRLQMPNTIVSAAVIQKNNQVKTASGRTAACSVQAIEQGWFDLYHRTQLSGTRFTQLDVVHTKRTAIVDDTLAYTLWGTTEVVGSTLYLSDTAFEVIGVVRHTDNVFQAKKPALYVPLLQGLEAGMEGEIQVLAADNALHSVFEATASAVMPKGMVYNLYQERVRSTLSLRYLAAFLSIILLSKMLLLLNSLSRQGVQAWKEKNSLVYGKKMIFPSIALFLQWVLGYGAWLAAIYFVLQLAVEPMYVFTQWMPKDPSDFLAYKEIFSKMIEKRSAFTVYLTESVQEYRNIGMFIKAGTIMMLFALIIPKRKRKNQ